jgi:hypothetical protein
MFIKAFITTLILGSSSLAMAHGEPVRAERARIAHVAIRPVASQRERGHGPVVHERTTYQRGGERRAHDRFYIGGRYDRP